MHAWRRSSRSTTRLEAHQALADPDARAWIDLVDPSPERVERIAHKLGLHPLIAEDILERNQRAKVEEIDGDLHIVIFDLHFDGEVKLTEVDIVLGERFLLTSHAADVRAAGAGPAPERRRAAPRPRPRLPAVRDARRHRRRLLPGARRAVRGPRLARGRGHRDADLLDAAAAVHAEAGADGAAPRDVTGTRGPQPAHEPGVAPHPARAHPLLPGRVRPPDPGRRRGGQRPRARGGDARRLPVDGEQQPVRDHEAPDRRDRDPGRRGRGRGDLRDERGRCDVRWRGAPGVLDGDGADRGAGGRDRRLPAADRLDLRARAPVSRSRPAAPWGASRRRRPAPSRAAWPRPSASGSCCWGPPRSAARAGRSAR